MSKKSNLVNNHSHSNSHSHSHSSGLVNHNHHPVTQPKAGFKLRLALFFGVAVLVVAGAVFLILPAADSSASAQYTVQVTMGGFQPATLSIPAGKPVTVKLVNTDSPYHTDGGGFHQFASPQLGIDAKVDPKSSKIITIPAAKAGTYTFYCDICCGGKENPTMQGKLVVV